MATEKFNSTEETIDRNVSNTTKWLSDATAAIADTYNKQSRHAFDIYNKFMGSALKTDNGDSNPMNVFWGFDMFRKNIELFQKNIEMISSMTKDMMRTTVNSATKKNTPAFFQTETKDSIMEAYNKQMKQMADFNRSFFEMFSKQFHTTKIDFDSLSENFQKGMENSFTVSREAIEKILDSYHTQAGLIVEAERKMFQELDHQIDLMTKGSLKFWSDLMTGMEPGKSNGKSATWKEASHESKKTTTKSKAK